MVEALDNELIVPMDKLLELGRLAHAAWFEEEDEARFQEFSREIRGIALEAVIARGLEKTPFEGTMHDLRHLGGYIDTYLIESGRSEIREDEFKFMARILRDVGRLEYQRRVKEQYGVGSSASRHER